MMLFAVIRTAFGLDDLSPSFQPFIDRIGSWRSMFSVDCLSCYRLYENHPNFVGIAGEDKKYVLLRESFPLEFQFSSLLGKDIAVHFRYQSTSKKFGLGLKRK